MAEKDYQYILVERDERVGIVTLNRPKELNALRNDLIRELADALEEFDHDDGIGCIVITGAGEKAFAAGADIKEMSDKSPIDMLLGGFSAWVRIKQIHTPMIAAVGGYALGGGCELALQCDMIVASENARFGQPEIMLGVIPGAGGTQRLARTLGKYRTMEMVLTGAQVTAQELHALGLVNRVVPKGEHLTEALKLAKTVAAQAPVAVRLAKDAVNAAFETTLEQGLEIERKNFFLLFATEDMREGMQAFIDKRKAEFQGKVSKAMEEAVILSAVRTPIGRYGGSLKDTRPDDLAALVIAEAVRRTNIDAGSIEDVILGCANQAGEDNRNVARMALLLANLPIDVAGQTVNRLCGSGLQAVNSAAQAIQTGAGDTFIAGGVESMTRAPFVLGKADSAFSRTMNLQDTTLGWRFVNPRLSALHYPYTMGETAENVAERTKISREEQDAYALKSHQRAVAAQQAGRFAEEIEPVTIPQKKGEPVVVTLDEQPRPDTTLEKLAALKPVFRKDGSVTAGNSSGINDGAAALVLMARSRAQKLGLTPRARIVMSAVAGVDPAYMGLGPIPATRKVLQRAGLSINDIDLIELNEAFAVQVLQCVRELEIDEEKLNVNGGAIALGHPLGCSGARLVVTLLHELERRGGRYGLATMCIGVGQGIATIIERL